MTTAKIVIFGDADAGKTHLVEQMLKPQIPYVHHGSSVGATYYYHMHNYLRLQILNVSGEPRLKDIRAKFYYDDSTIGVYCVDLSQPLNIKEIEKEIARFKKRNKDAAVILVGTKSDRCASDANEKLNHIKLNTEVERIVTSAVNNTGLTELLERLCTISQEKIPTTEIPQIFEFNLLKAARDKLPPSSPLYQTMDNLILSTEKLPEEKRQALGHEAINLVNALQNESIFDKSKAIENFLINCQNILENKYSKVLNVILIVAAAATVAVLTATLGFTIGFLAGSWSGPGAFISGILSGAAALTVLFQSASTGLLAGGLTAFGLFKDSATITAIKKIAQEAYELKSSNPDIEDCIYTR